MVDKTKKKQNKCIFFYRKCTFLFNKWVNAFGLCLIILLLTGCTPNLFLNTWQSLYNLKTSTVWLEKVSFDVSDHVNDDSPVLVHIVIPYSEDLMKRLSKMPAQEYFAKIDQIKLDSAEKLDIFPFELVRSETRTDLPISLKDYSGVGILVFANYTTPGNHRCSIGTEESVMIHLQDNDFYITPINHN